MKTPRNFNDVFIIRMVFSLYDCFQTQVTKLTEFLPINKKEKSFLCSYVAKKQFQWTTRAFAKIFWWNYMGV